MCLISKKTVQVLLNTNHKKDKFDFDTGPVCPVAL